jgi:hypothetical protein
MAMLTVFLDQKGILEIDFLDKGTTMNAEILSAGLSFL